MSNSTDAILLISGISGGALEKDGREIWGMSAGTLWRCVDTLGPTIHELTLAQDGSGD
jgi:hypothetical protein